MKPTLYAEDIRDKPPARMAQLGDVLADRILPRRCPDGEKVLGRHMPNHLQCDGRGFLYPDPPDGKPVVRFGPIYVPWVDWCESVWVRLGIVEVDDE